MKTLAPYAILNVDFTVHIDVVCAKCKTQALVVGGQPYKPVSEYEAEVHFSCPSCGFTLKDLNTHKFTAHINSKGQAVMSLC